MSRRLSISQIVATASALTLLTARTQGGSAIVTQTILPSGWALHSAADAPVQTDTMPQGASLSPDGKVLAVVASGFNPPSVAIYDTRTLKELKRVALAGAFGRPQWIGDRVLVAGANADAVFDVTWRTGSIRKISFAKKTFPVAIAVAGDRVSVATDGDASVRIGTLTGVSSATPIRVGDHPAGMSFTKDARYLFATVRSGTYIVAIDTATHQTQRISTGLHPSDVLVAGNQLFVAEADDDAVGVFDIRSRRRIADVFVGNGSREHGIVGASPNALVSAAGDVFVSLGAANQIAVIRGDRVLAYIPAGWYPTDIVSAGSRLFIIDGKGESAHPNPGFDFKSPGYRDYVAAIEFGSIRVVTIPGAYNASQNPQGSIGWDARPPTGTIVHSGGPIKHVFFILKENRTYDQVLGDMSHGNGDPQLVWFGDKVTPNQHALASAFGLFDNMYTNGEVSTAGHNWADASFDNDYVERYWPPVYGNRGVNDNGDLLNGRGAGVPHNGYIWDAAKAGGISFRDYGEMVNTPPGSVPGPIAPPTLGGRFDSNYVTWNLKYSDLDRVKEWRREFDGFIRNGTLPALEWIWLPNDHTAGSSPGALTPAAYVAQNDYAVGQLVDAVSHSRVWNSSAIFITEDDAQDGADHVSDQRTTLFIASPYAVRGVHHEHYSTVSVIRTIELLLGLKPMSTYDARALPLYAAFSGAGRQRAFVVIPPRIDVTARNSKVAFGADLSDAMNFSRPDAAPPVELNNVIAHNLETVSTTPLKKRISGSAPRAPRARFRARALVNR